MSNTIVPVPKTKVVIVDTRLNEWEDLRTYCAERSDTCSKLPPESEPPFIKKFGGNTSD